MARTIYIAGYPKTGTVFFTRLLGDALNSPTGAYWSEHDHQDIATEGVGRPGSYVVRRGHFVLVPGDTCVVPRAHRLAPDALTDELVLWITRDPRDIAVSAYYYFSSCSNINAAINAMGTGTGPFRSMGSFQQYTRTWLKQFPKHFIRYEDLVATPLQTIKRLIHRFDLQAPSDRHIEEACHRQSFEVRKKQIEKRGDSLNLGKNLNLRHIRKGVVGDWENHFDKQSFKYVDKWFGNLLIELGYIEKGEKNVRVQ